MAARRRRRQRRARLRGQRGSAVVDFTALGDPINVAAGLQASAGAGQVVFAADVHASLREVLSPGARRQTLRVGGREVALPVLVADV